MLRPVLAAALLIPVLAGCAEAAQPATEPAPAASTPAAPSPSVFAVEPASGSVSGGTQITARGIALEGVTTARVGAVEVPVAPAGDGASVTLTAPASANFAAGSQPLVLLDGAGTTVYEGQFDYQVVTPVDRQLAYALAHWKNYNTAEFETLGDTDCVNFTSQTLLARGWTQSDEWHYGSSGVLSASATWRSSTAMRNWLQTRPDLATPLDDSQRDQVVVGDIAQFDWDNTGDRDHTGVVTKVEKTDAGTKIYFAGHTLDSDYRDVDQAITVDHPGGTAYYWHLAQ